MVSRMVTLDIVSVVVVSVVVVVYLRGTRRRRRRRAAQKNHPSSNRNVFVCEIFLQFIESIRSH